jgi:hypothetical protein
MSENNTNVNDILNALDDIRNKTTYAIYIPSKKREHMFKEISTAQEKRLVKSIIDNPIFGTQLIYALREMIKENSADPLDVNSLTVLDKLAICLGLRSKCIGSKFTHTNQETGVEVEVDIDKLIEQLNDIQVPEPKVFENDDIKIVCALPTIKEEYDLEVAMGRKLKNFENVTPENASEMLESAYIGEIVKYIKSITLNMCGEMREIELSGLDFDTRLKFANKLSSKLTTSVLGYVKAYNKLVKEAMTDQISNVTVEVTSDFFTD